MKVTKVHIYIAIGVLVLLAVLSFYFYRRGKKQVTIQVAPGELPGNPGSGTQYGASNDEIKTIARELFEDMDGYNWSGHNMAPYNRALLLNDSDLVKLYNTFNTLHQTDSGQTLTAWIDNEKYFDNEIPDALLTRFAKLNLI